MKKYRNLRISLLTFTLGLASVFIFDGLSKATDEIKVELPQVESAETLIIYPIKGKSISPNRGKDETCARQKGNW